MDTVQATLLTRLRAAGDTNAAAAAAAAGAAADAAATADAARTAATAAACNSNGGTSANTNANANVAAATGAGVDVVFGSEAWLLLWFWRIVRVGISVGLSLAVIGGIIRFLLRARQRR
jgi:hypothetical protein